jgi:fructosamine-3-kinase
LPSLLPQALLDGVAAELRANGDTSPVESVQRVTGGDINAAARVDTRQASYFLKWNPDPLPRLFEVEACGLQLLADAGAVRVPEVYAQVEPTAERPAFILLEWIEQGWGGSRAAVGEVLGRQLAMLHRESAATFGLDHDNYIGSLRQPNDPLPTWLDFYRERRLAFQRDLARQRGYMPAERDRRLNWLMDHLARWIIPDASPALIHGDLWGGNYLIDRQGQPVLVDPAVYYGHREIELAFTELFGGFPSSFYAAYNQAWPLPAGYEERRALYQLYHLLTHLNMFGETYGSSVDGILSRYAP